MRIELAGALAAGKSTLAGKLEEKGFRLVYEDLSRNPYLELRKQDPERYDLPCQRAFVEEKVRAIAAEAGRGRIVSDFSLAVERAYLSLYLSHRPDWLAELEALVDRGIDATGEPDALIYLSIDPMNQLKRIRSRGRDFEQGHDLAFLERINSLVEARVRDVQDRGIRVIEIGSLSLEADERVFERLVDEMEAVFRGEPSREDADRLAWIPEAVR